MTDFLDEIRGDLTADAEASRRSQQTETGGSQLLGCRAEAVLRLNGVPKSDPRLSWQAFVGSAIDSRIGKARLRRRPHLLVQHSTNYRGVWFTIDEYDPETKALSDWKSKDDAAACSEGLKYVKDRQRAQIHGGAAGLIAEGYPVETVRLVFLPRAGSLDGAQVFEEPFSPEWADRGVEWAAEIGTLATEIGEKAAMMADEPDVAAYLDGLRDEAPGFCYGYCPFVSLCRGPGQPDTAPDPETLDAAQRFLIARIDVDEAEGRKKYYRNLMRGAGPVVTDGQRVAWTRDSLVYEEEPDLSAVDVASYEAIVGVLPRKQVSHGKASELRVTKVRAK